MTPNPYVVGIIPGDSNLYGGPLYAKPNHNPTAWERPCYGPDDIVCFKYGAEEVDEFDQALEYLYDRSLIAEVHRFRESCALITRLKEDIKKIEDWVWEAEGLKTSSARRLEEANTLDRIDEANAERRCQSTQRTATANMRRGCPI
jgi:hypothetical protein